MSVQTGRAFNEWLRTQLKVKKMSQRQLYLALRMRRLSLGPSDPVLRAVSSEPPKRN
ncbi:MAG: hypothetical protein H0T04_00215 [Chloroflexi bacterium]|nr:hypothetical protein [Chloroflexota bacterium]